MPSYTSLGSFVLSDEIAVDPFGKIYRGITLKGAKYDRHLLVRTFAEELTNAEIAEKLDEANRVASLIAGGRGFGSNYRISAEPTPHVACDYVPGRSLTQMIEKAKQEEIPLGVDHALSVLQNLAQSLIQLHGKGVHHGVLSPHSVWVSFE